MNVKDKEDRLTRIAHAHGWVKNPVRSFQWLASRLMDTNGACPCKPKQRPLCPCKEAAKEIAESGHCMCFEFLHPKYNYKKNIFDK